jgi:hypothetical protein
MLLNVFNKKYHPFLNPKKFIQKINKWNDLQVFMMMFVIEYHWMDSFTIDILNNDYKNNVNWGIQKMIANMYMDNLKFLTKC